MTDNKFERGNENPQFHFKNEKGGFFLSPGESNRSNIMQGHHINPNNIVDRAYNPLQGPDSNNNVIARLFSGLKSIGYDQADPDRNRVWLPTSDEDALRLGVAKHDTNHDPYDRFMARKYEEIGKRADERIAGITHEPGTPEHDAAVKRIYGDADKDMAGLQQWVKKALGSVDADGKPILVLNDRDPRLPTGVSAADINEDAQRRFKIYEFSSGNGSFHGSLKDDEVFKKGFSGEPNGKYGHALDFTPDGQPNWDPATNARIKVNDSELPRFRDANGIIDKARWLAHTLSDGFKQLITKTRSLLLEIAADERGVLLLDLEGVEREFLRRHRNSVSKMNQFADYAQTRAKLVLEGLRDPAGRVPEFAKIGLKKADEYFRKPNGRIDKSRATASIATAVLAVANVWVEYDKRKDTPGAFEAYLINTAKDAVSLTSLAFAGGIVLTATFTPLGPVVLFTLGAVATYAAIKNVVSYLASPAAGLDPNGYTFAVVKTIDTALTQFETQVKAYIDLAVKEVQDGALKLLEYFSGRSLEWFEEEAVGVVVADEARNKSELLDYILASVAANDNDGAGDVREVA
jgi:hypothetical protein